MAYESTTVTLTCMNSYDNIVCLFQWVQQQLLYTNGSLGLLLTFYGASFGSQRTKIFTMK
jgi:hypothetical protein